LAIAGVAGMLEPSVWFAMLKEILFPKRIGFENRKHKLNCVLPGFQSDDSFSRRANRILYPVEVVVLRADIREWYFRDWEPNRIRRRFSCRLNGEWGRMTKQRDYDAALLE